VSIKYQDLAIFNVKYQDRMFNIDNKAYHGFKSKVLILDTNYLIL